MPFPTRTPGTWLPRIAAQFIEPLMVTAKNLIIRDQAEALVIASSDITLQPFQNILYANRDQSWYESRLDRFPIALIQPASTLPPFGAEYWIPDEVNRIVVQLAITGSDADNLTLQIVRYVKAVDWMWRAASYADLTWNLDMNHTTAPIIDVIDHNYGPIKENGPNSFLHEASLTLTAQFTEH